MKELTQEDGAGVVAIPIRVIDEHTKIKRGKVRVPVCTTSSYYTSYYTMR